MGLVRLALRNPYLVAVVSLAVFIIGLTTLFRIPVDLLPQFKTPAVQILTLYPGMPTDIVERDITNRLERWTSQANGIERQESRSLIGVSVVKDFFRSDIDSNTALSQVSSLAISDLYYLPPGTIPPMVMPFDPTASQPLALLAISSDSLDETAIYDIAYFQIRNLLSGTPGVIAPAVYGGRLRRILVYLDKDKLQARKLSPMDVVNAVRTSNVLIPTGDAKIGDYDYQISSNAMVPQVSEMNDIPIKYEEGKPVFVRDVGKVKDSYAIQTNAVDIAGKRAVVIPIYRQPGANTIEVVDGIKNAIPGIQQTVTNGKQLKMGVIVDQSVYVREAIASLEREGVLGAFLAALMIFLFLGSVRSMLIILISLPLSILSAFIALYFTHQTINAMTLGGLALAVGILMDNGIVILENIARHLKMGKEPIEAAHDGALEVVTPVFVATLTLCVVFVPVAFLTGIGKFLFTPLALAVVFAVIASYVLSMTLVPAASAGLLKANLAATADHNSAFSEFQKAYERTLGFVMKQKRTFFAILVLLFVSGLFLFPFVGQELFPQIDSGQFTILVHAPSGTRMEKTENLTQSTERIVRQVIPQSEIRMIVSNVGILYDWPAAYTPNSGPHDAFVLVQLERRHSRSSQQYADLLRRRLPHDLPGTQFAFDTGGLVSSALSFGLPSPLDIQVEGPKLSTDRQIADVLRKKISEIRGTADVRIEQNLDYPQITLDVNRTRAAALGVTEDDIVKNVVTALNGSTTFLPSFWIDEKTGNHYFVGATYREKDIRSKETLADIPVTGAHQSEPIPLRNVAVMGTGKAPVEVSHANIRRVIDVYSNVVHRDIGSVSRDVEGILRRLEVPEGYKVFLRGEVSSMKKSFVSLGFGLLLAAVLVYLVMVAQFRSFLDPLIVMFSVPPGFLGVIVILWLTRTTLNIQSLMGVIMVIGLTVSYSVLIVDFANARLLDGKSPKEAVMEAASVRLRPILMTSLAAILGFVPMAFRGNDANMPLARAVIGGLLVSTIVKLFLIPILYDSFKLPSTRYKQ